MAKKNILDQLSIGSWIQIGHPAIAEIMSSAGFDWLGVDLEHSTISLREAEELIRVIDLKGIIPLVRVASNDAQQIKRIMDAGSHGVIVPMINSRNEAQEVVSAVKYPPEGHRSIGLARAHGYGINFKNYFDNYNEHSIIICQIENKIAVEKR